MWDAPLKLVTIANKKAHENRALCKLRCFAPSGWLPEREPEGANIYAVAFVWKRPVIQFQACEAPCNATG